VGANMEIFKML